MLVATIQNNERKTHRLPSCNMYFYLAMIFITLAVVIYQRGANRYTFHEFMDFILSAERSGASTNQGKKARFVPRKHVNGRESTENYHGDLTLYHVAARLTNLGDSLYVISIK